MTALTVLHIEADDALAAHVAAALQRTSTEFHVTRAPTMESGIRLLLDGTFDAALVNLDTPAPTSTAAMTDAELVRDVTVHAPTTAIVACTARPTAPLGTLCLRAGASDVVHVSDLSPRVLERVLRYGVDRKAYETSIRQLTTRDDLTGAGNRRALDEWYRAAANKLSRHGGQVVVGVIDLDDFKAVNDDHGHRAGDRVLTETATRLANAFRPEDAAVRLGGDEFAIVIHSLDTDAVDDVERRARRALTAPPLTVEDRQVDASIGFASTDDPGDRLVVLLDRADSRMYAQKRTQRP